MYVYRCPECPARVALAMYEWPQDREPIVACQAHAPRAVNMVRMPDTAKALLRLDGLSDMRRAAVEAGVARAGLAPLKVEHLKANGILLPETQDALEWLYRHRERNGMAEAFCKVGGRRCMDLVAFARLMREQRA